MNQGSTRLTETAGILIGATVVRTSAGAAPASWLSSPAVWPSSELGNDTFTGRQCFPEFRSVETFDQTTELPSNVRLVPSSNS